MIDMYEDYEGDHNIKRLAYVGLNAMNYLYARKLLHSIASEIDCSDPIETIFNADQLAAVLQYNKMESGEFKHAKGSNSKLKLARI